jgi:hypothetical protein
MSARFLTTPSARRWLTAAVAVLALTAVGALAAVAGTGAGGVVRPAKPAPPVARAASVGPARLVVPARWRTVAPASAGLAGAPIIVFRPESRPWTRVVAVFDRTVAPSLIPPVLQPAGLPAQGSPKPTRVSGRPAWTYDADVPGGDGRGGSVTVLPTTAGVLAIACTSVAGRRADAGCASDVGSITVPGTTALVPSRALALGVSLPQVLDRLNRERSRHRATLNAARTNASQARAARRLAADHRAAAREVRRLAGPAAVSLVRDLTAVAQAYGALADAADAAASAKFASAATSVRQAEAVVAGAVAAVPRPRTAAVAPHSATPRTTRAAAAAAGVSTLLFALLTTLAMSAGAATGNSNAAAGLWRRLSPRAVARSGRPARLELVKIGNGARTHAWRGDHPACRRSGYSTLREPRTPSDVTPVGTGEPTCPRCRAVVSGGLRAGRPRRAGA